MPGTFLALTAAIAGFGVFSMARAGKAKSRAWPAARGGQATPAK
jgi:hypothetical protein